MSAGEDAAGRRGDERAAEPIGPLAVLPAFFRLAGKRVALAGGSDAVAWKAELVAATGARVEIFAPNPGARLVAVAERHAAVTLFRRPWAPADLAGVSLAIGDGADLNAARAFAAAARAAGAPVNIIDRPELSDFSFGAIVNRSPLVIGLSTDGAAPVFAQSLRARLEALLPPNLALWAEAARDWRKRLSGRGLDFRRRRDFWERFAARAERSDAAPTEEDFAAIAEERPTGAQIATGRILIVGAGPGDPDLLTLRALRALQSADVILYDALIGADVLELARREAIRIPVGKRGRTPSQPRDETTALLLRLASEGKVACSLRKPGSSSPRSRCDACAIRLPSPLYPRCKPRPSRCPAVAQDRLDGQRDPPWVSLPLQGELRALREHLEQGDLSRQHLMTRILTLRWRRLQASSTWIPAAGRRYVVSIRTLAIDNPASSYFSRSADNFRLSARNSLSVIVTVGFLSGQLDPQWVSAPRSTLCLRPSTSLSSLA